MIVVYPNNDISSPNIKDQVFEKTNVGEILTGYVKSGDLELRVDYNEDLNTSFRVYSNPSNTDKKMVIPITEN